ncbi:MAG: preprotein translocase subunit Sec61beta [Candidatus Micrarchaeaceae archaeon]
MATISSPQQQAGVLSFYDAPEKGPKIDPRYVIAILIVFVIIVLVMHKIYGI